MTSGRFLRTTLFILLAIPTAIPAESPRRAADQTSPDDPALVDIKGVIPSTTAAIRSIAAADGGSAAFVPSPDGLAILKVETSTGKVLTSAASSQQISAIRSSRSGALIAALSSAGGTVAVFSAADL